MKAALLRKTHTKDTEAMLDRFKKKPKIVCDMKHHYRWNYFFKMWMHTGVIHFVEVP